MNSFEIKNLETYQAAYAASVEDPEKFWADLAENNFLWKRPWDVVLTHDFSVPKISWFEGAQLNITENCIDRHLDKNGE
jgi:acetyl-CoA synthetase